MNCESITIIGISLNIIGIVLIFVYGLSPFISTGGYVMLHSEKVINDKNSPPNKRKRKYRRLAVTGLALCVTGNLLQMASVYLSA
jgi:hypothetical protein